MSVDLNELFMKEVFPQVRSVLFFSDFSKNGHNTTRPLTEEENRLTQKSRFENALSTCLLKGVSALSLQFGCV